MKVSFLEDLERLDKVRNDFDGKASKTKRSLVAALRKSSAPSAEDLHRFHELLCFLRAYPSDAALLAEVEKSLHGFSKRKDLGRFRDELESSGIAGCVIRYPFFYPTAVWLAERFGDLLEFDEDQLSAIPIVETLLPLLAHYAETPGLDEGTLDFAQWIERMRGSSTAARFILERFSNLLADQPLLERLWDGMAPWMVLESSEDTPTRTHAKWPRATPCWKTTPLRRERPKLVDAVATPPIRIVDTDVDEGREFVQMAREAMVTRSRDLDAFAYGDENDVRVCHCGDGLAFAVIGQIPERRLLFESVYAFLTLQNGVPIGYVLSSALFGSSEIAYNVFETYRGGESGLIYGRVLGMIRALFHSDTYTIYPYQLGQNNDEALDSGAYWFYRKLGFSPRHRETLALLASEERKIARNPAHRSSRSVLSKLADQNVYWSMDAARDDVIGELPMANVGLAVTDYLAGRFGADREAGEALLAEEARELLDVESEDFSAAENLAFARFSPIVGLLAKEIGRWTAEDRRALGEVIRLKGSRRESDFVAAFDAHHAFRRAIVRLARAPETSAKERRKR